MDIIEILNNLSLESNIKLEEVPEIDLYMDQKEMMKKKY